MSADFLIGPRRFVFVLTAVGALLFFGVSGCATNRAQAQIPPPTVPSAQTETTRIPPPPRQSASWTPPNATDKLPQTLLNATGVLFANGLADPRGCEYRIVTVLARSIWGRETKVETHGWTFTNGGDDQAYAICWDGLVYPVITVGVPADLQSDIAASLKAIKLYRKKDDPRYPRDTAARVSLPNYNPSPSSQEVNVSVWPKAMHAVLLLRLDENDLAAQVWQAVGLRVPVDKDNKLVEIQNDDYVDPLKMLAISWIATLYERALTAHMHADDRLSLVDCRLLRKAVPALNAEINRRKYWTHSEMPKTADAAFDFFGFTKPVALLERESERRLRLPFRPKIDLKTFFQQEKNRQKRIVLLIDRLDEITARQWGQPGGVDLGEWGTGVVDALVREGEPAVEPLLNVLEKDTRLTRSVSFGRDFSLERNLISVKSAAFSAIRRIVNFGTFASAYEQPTVAQIRDYWRKNRGLPQPERWYRTLADDGAPPTQWMEAAEKIFQPTNISDGDQWVSIRPIKRGEKAKRRGEVLRAKSNPSIAQLLEKRARARLMANAQENSTRRPHDASEAARLALMRHAWEPRDSVPILAEITREYVAIMKPLRGYEENYAHWIGNLTVAQMRSGTKVEAENAASVYGTFIESIERRAGFGYLNEDAFEPLWTFPKHARLARTAEHVFGKGDTLRLFEHDPTNKSQGVYKAMFFMRAPLIVHPVVRARILEVLQDRSVIGTVEVRDGQVQYKIGEGGGGSRIAAKGAKYNGTTSNLRICDFCALTLNDLQQYHAEKSPPAFSRFHLEKPEAERDGELRKLADFLRRRGDDLYAKQDDQYGDAQRFSYSRQARVALREPSRRGR